MPAAVGGPDGARCAGRRVLGGPDRRGRPARGRRDGARGGGLPARRGSPGSTPAAARSRPGSSTRIRTSLFARLARGRVAAAPARRGLPRDPRGRRRHPLDGRGDPRGVDRRAARPRPSLARRDARPRGHDDRGEVRLRPRPRDRDPARSRRRTSSASEGPIEIVPTYLGAHAVPPEFRARPDGTEAYVRSVIDEQLPGVAAHGRARFCDVFCENGVFGADQSRRILEAAAATGWGSGCTPTSWRRPAARSSRRSSGPLSADHLATPSEAGIDALAAAAADESRGRRHGPAGDDLVPDEGPRRAGPDVHRSRHPGRRSAPTSIPGTSPTAEPATGDDRRLPRARADARRGAQPR